MNQKRTLGDSKKEVTLVGGRPVGVDGKPIHKDKKSVRRGVDEYYTKQKQ